MVQNFETYCELTVVLSLFSIRYLMFWAYNKSVEKISKFLKLLKNSHIITNSENSFQ